MGNTPGGDDVVNFHVNTAPESMSFDPSSGYQMTLPTRLSYPEVLGVLFPDEIQAGITLTRNADQSRTAPVAGDQFEFHILQSTTYSFILSCDDIPPGTQLLGLTDGAGNPASYTLDQNNEVLTAYLYPGTYLLNVGGWDPRMAHNRGVSNSSFLAVLLRQPAGPRVRAGAGPGAALFRLDRVDADAGFLTVIPFWSAIRIGSWSDSQSAFLADRRHGTGDCGQFSVADRIS